MTTYRLDRRFVLPATGLNLVLAGVATAVGFLASAVPVLPWVLGVLAALALANAVRVYVAPPTVVLTDPTQARFGGRLTVRPVVVRWLDVEGVSVVSERLLIDRGEAGVLSFPLAYVGRRSGDLMREIHERLNTANGYRRFDPS